MKTRIVGLIPAAGSASRFGGIPKFLLPFNSKGETLLEFQVSQMMNFVNEVVVITRECWVSTIVQLNLPVKICLSEPTTLSAVLKMAGEKYQADQYLVGFPDTLYLGENPFLKISDPKYFDSDLTLACWQISEKLIGQVGQVLIEQNLVVDLRDKDKTCGYSYLWGALRLSKDFMNFIEDTNLTISSDISRYIHTSSDPVHADIIMGEYLDLGNFERYRDYIVSHTN